MTRINLSKEQCIGAGSFGSVYQIGNRVVKVYHGFHEDKRFVDDNRRLMGKVKGEANHEYGVAAELYNQGISVPHPYGVFRVMVDGKKSFGFVMDRVKGTTLWDLATKCVSKKKYELGYLKACEELKKAAKLGFKFLDGHDGNVIVREEDSKVFLIDFGKCKSPIPKTA